MIQQHRTIERRNMSSTEKRLLDQLLTDLKAQNAPGDKDSDFFEWFVADQIMSQYGLSDDEIEAGVIAGGRDGGIDAVYALIDDSVMESDPDPDLFQKIGEAVIEVIVIQAKRQDSFEEVAIQKIRSTLEDLITIGDIDRDVFLNRYNSDLRDFFEVFWRNVERLQVRFPKYIFRIIYATRGQASKVHTNARELGNDLKRAIERELRKATVTVEFFGAGDLLSLASRKVTGPATLPVAESLSAADGGYICLVKLSDYYEFITDNGRRKAELFTANVREYEGDVDVNLEIRASLEAPSTGAKFWWLNNGITIVAEEASLTRKSLSLKNAKVVNGLQTSHVIYSYFASQRPPADDRLLLVKVLETNDEATRNAIIRATNSQSKIKPYALHSTEKIHHYIEQHLKHHGLYYERQKNYYKNLGYPKRQIVSIQYLAQAVAATLLGRANDSRGRPSSLLKDDSQSYTQIFTEAYPIDLYLQATRILHIVEQYLKTKAPEYAKKEYTNLRFPLALYATRKVLHTPYVTAKQLAEFPLEYLDPDTFTEHVAQVWGMFVHFQNSNGWEPGRTARSPESDKFLLERLKAEFVQAATSTTAAES